MKHTPEPWGKEDFQIFPFTDITQRGLQIEDFARSVACVNACAGMDDPETVIRWMKSIPVGKDYGPDLSSLLKEMEKLKAERDEIMLCLKQLMSIVDIHSSATDNDFAWAEMGYARKIISKMKGINP
jgi:hypothetical protein